MSYRAVGWVSCRRLDARARRSPRAHAVGTLRQAYERRPRLSLFEQPNVVSEVATVDAIFARSGNRILAVGVPVWLQRL
jgi:hypothetical protein